MNKVIVAASSTVAVRTPENGIPVPGVDRIAGFTTTMYAIVKNVVMPAMASVRRWLRCMPTLLPSRGTHVDNLERVDVDEAFVRQLQRRDDRKAQKRELEERLRQLAAGRPARRP